MKMKRLVSAIAALAMSVSAFAGLTAFAAEETATLEAMRSWNGSKGTFTVSDTEIMGQSGPSSKSSNYPGIGVVKFSFENADGLSVSKATLTYNAKHTQNKTNSCTYDMYTVGNPSYDFSNVPLLSTADGANDGIYTQTANGTAWTYSGILGDLTSVHQGTITNAEITETVDVTDYVAAQTAVNGKYYAAFAFSNSIRGVYALNPSLTITYADATAVETDITINFVYGDENTAIPSESLPTGTVTSDKQYSGQTYVAEYPATFDAVEGDAKYRYTYAGAEGDDTITVSETAADNVITLKYAREQLEYKNVVAKAVDAAGTELETLASGTIVVGDTLSYSYSKYLTDADNKVTYVCDTTQYSASLVASADDAANSAVVAYSAYDGTAYFVEQEDITNSSAAQSLTSPNYSGGIAYRGDTAGVEAFTVADAGIYSVTVAASCRNTNNNSTFTVYKNSVEEANIIASGDVKGTSQNTVQAQGTLTTTDVELAAGDVIILAGDNGQTWVDYIFVEKTGDVEVDEPILSTDPPMVAVEDFGEYTEYLGDPAKAYTGTFTVDPTKHYPVSSVTWYVGEASATTEFDTIISSGTVVTGLVVVAEDLTTIPDVSAWCNLYYGE